jgi:hypothetical protein
MFAWPQVTGRGLLTTTFPALVSPGSARVRTYEKGSELGASGKSGLW